MNRLIAIAAATACAGVGLSAAHAATRQLDFAGSTSLDISLPGRVTISEGPVARLVISGPEAALRRVRFDGERLRYERDWKNWFGWNEPGLRVEIVTPDLRRLAIHAGTNAKLLGVSGDAVALSVHSGARLEGVANVKSMSARVHSGADLRLTGVTERLDLAVHSGAEADLGGLAVDYADVRAHSGAGATVNPRLAIKANAHSGADIRLLQRPALVESEVHSGGGVRIPGR